MVGRWARVLSVRYELALEREPSRAYGEGKIASRYNDFTGKASSNTLLSDSGIPESVTATGKCYLPVAKAYVLNALADEK